MNGNNFISFTTFSLLTSEEIQKISVQNVSENTSIKKDVLDNRSIGPERGEICGVCNKSYSECLGHFSYLTDLNVYNPIYLKKIKYVISNVCFNCLTYISKKSSLLCSNCKQSIKFSYEFKYTKYKLELIKKHTDVNKVKQQTIVSFEVVKNLFERISDETSEKLGFKNNHPKNMLLNNYPFLGKKYREPNSVNGKLLKAALSNLYYQLIKSYEQYRNTTDANRLELIHNRIQMVIFAITDGEKYPLTSTKQKTLIPSLVKKQGFIIYELITRRILNTIRSIIVPASPSEIAINQIGIPDVFASKIEIYEYVNNKNFQKLNEILNNELTYPRLIKKIYYNNNGTMSYSLITKNTKLMIGDFISRTLLDDDVVLVNRQPTLTKGSILALYSKIVHGYKTLMINAVVCKNYGADFDGDEMNIYVPVMPDVRNELEDIMILDKNIFSASTGKLIVSILQDHCAILYLLTNEKFFIRKSYLKHLLVKCNIYDKEIKEYEDQTYKFKYIKGKDIFSLFLPSGVNYTKNNDQPDSIPFIIKDGYLISGRVNKTVIMAGQKGLVDAIDMLYGRKESIKLINNLMILTENMMDIYGLTTSLRDFYFDEEDVDNVLLERKSKYLNLLDYIKDYNNLTPKLEENISIKCSQISSKSEIITHLVNKYNYHFIDIINSGAKGDISNINKMFYTIGQITIGPKRFNDKLNLLPSNDVLSLHNFGIIETPYLFGLTSSELAMSHKNGVYSITQQQVETAGPGYKNKQMSEVSKNFIVKSDYTIRYNDKILLPHCFGFKYTSESTYKINFIIDDYLVSDKQSFNLPKNEFKKFNNFLINIYNFIIDCFKQSDIYFNIKSELQLNLPFDFQLLYSNIKTKETIVYKRNQNKVSKDNSIYNDMPKVLSSIEKILKYYNTSPIKEVDSLNKYQMFIALLYYLHPVNIQLNKTEFDLLIDNISYLIRTSQYEPGYPILLEAVTGFTSGITQSLLSSIHSLGGGNSTSKKLDSNLRVTKQENPADNIITTYIKKEYKDNVYIKVTLKELVNKVNVVFKKEQIDIKDNDILVRNIKKDMPTEYLLFSFDLNPKELKLKNMLLPIIYHQLHKYLSNNNLYNEILTFIYISYDIKEIIDEEEGKIESETINIYLDGTFKNIREFILEFIDEISLINIRDNIFSDIVIDQLSRDDINYKCYLKGISLEESFKIDFINKKYITTNDLYSLYRKYGSIGYYTGTFNNLVSIVPGISQKFHHMISSVITFNPDLIAMTRQGLNKLSENKWDSIAFESQLQNLIESALMNLKCDDETISSQTIYGKAPEIGTGTVNVRLNINKLNELYPNYKIVNNEKKVNPIFKQLKLEKNINQ